MEKKKRGSNENKRKNVVCISSLGVFDEERRRMKNANEEEKKERRWKEGKRRKRRLKKAGRAAMAVWARDSMGFYGRSAAVIGCVALEPSSRKIHLRRASASHSGLLSGGTRQPPARFWGAVLVRGKRRRIWAVAIAQGPHALFLCASV